NKEIKRKDKRKMVNSLQIIKTHKYKKVHLKVHLMMKNPKRTKENKKQNKVMEMLLLQTKNSVIGEKIGRNSRLENSNLKQEQKVEIQENQETKTNKKKQKTQKIKKKDKLKNIHNLMIF